MTIRSRSDTLSARGARGPRGRRERSRTEWAQAHGWAALAAAVVLAGAGLRVAAYAPGRPLWFDEALLALNIIDPPPDGLLGQLSFAQGAPPGFLLAQSALVSVLGPGEHALRLIPLASGIAALALFWPVARRIVGPPAALGALVLFAALAPLVEYSAELKQYSGDVLAALAVTGAALLVLERPSSVRRAVALGAVGAVALWLSHAALLVIAGVGAVLAARAARRRDPAALGLLAGAAALWLASAASAYVVSLRHLTGLQRHVVGGDSPFSPPIPPRAPTDLAWPWEVSAMTLEGLAGWPTPFAVGAALLGAVGAVSLLRRDASRGWLLLAPVAVALLASALGRYPVGDRFVLFLMPALVLFLAEATRWARGLLVRDGDDALVRISASGVAAAPLALLIGWQLWIAGQELESPTIHENIRPALRELADSWRPGDRLYVSHGAQYALRYYIESGWIARASSRPLPWRLDAAPAEPGNPTAAALVGRPPTVVIGRPIRDRDPGVVGSDLEALGQSARAWVLVSHAIHGDREFLLARLDAAGDRRHSSLHAGAALHLYDLRERAR